jgi:hypothetical protein
MMRRRRNSSKRKMKENPKMRISQKKTEMLRRRSLKRLRASRLLSDRRWKPRKQRLNQSN